MNHRWLWTVTSLLPLWLPAQTYAPGPPPTAQTDRGPYARVAILRPNDNDTIDFEAGYIRHLAWHQQAKDTWTWYGWTIWAGERQRWFVYATFGHSAASLDNPVSPADDERDTIVNVNPHVQYLGSALFEFLPAISQSSGNNGEPQSTARLELTSLDVLPGTEKAFEAAIAASQSTSSGETLWFRMIAGGAAPRYIRLRPRANLSTILDGKSEQALPEAANRLVAKVIIEILNLRPAMCYGVSPVH